MVYAGIPERKAKLQHNPDIRGDQDNQDNPGKKQAFYPKFFVNEQQSDHKVHQSQRSAACETSRSNVDQFSSFKSSPGRAVPAHCLDISCLSLEHHKISRKNTNYHSTRSRDHSFLPSSSHTRETGSNDATRPLDKQSYSFHRYKTEKDVNRNVNDKEEIGAIGGFDTFSSNINKRLNTLEKDEHCSEISKNERGNDKNLSFRRKKTPRSLDSLEESVVPSGADVKSLYFLPNDAPKLLEENQQSLNSTKSKKSVNGTFAKISKPGILQRISRNFQFLTKDFESNREQSKKENEQLTANAPLTATERCEYYCSQVYPKDQVFLDEYPILRNGHELNIIYQKTINEKVNGLNNWNQNVKNLNIRIRREKVDECQLDEQNLRKIFWEMFQEKSENGKKSYMSSSVDKSCCSDRGGLTHETTSGNKDSLEIGYSISQLGRYCLQNSNNPEKMQVIETMTGGESWERCLGWITKVDLDALSQGTNSSNSIGHAKPQGKLDIIKGILLDIFVCICF